MPIDTSIGDCLNWTGAKTVDGYGHLSVNRKRIYVHRVSFCDANGLSLADIDGLVVRHKCDTPSCYKPSHLELGTQAENMRDMWSRGRGKTNPKRGNSNGNAKLTPKIVEEIKRLYVKGSRDFNCTTLGARFGVDRTQIHNIVTGRQWGCHVGGANAN